VKKFKLWAGLIALFVSGVLLGVVGTWHVAEHKAIESLVREKPRFPRFILRGLDRELGLSDDQRKRIEPIVCSAFRELMALRDRARPERERILQQSMEAVKGELSPEQQKKLDALHERLKARRDRGEEGHRGRPGPEDPCQ
jgi:hypothetical protein